MKIKSLLIFFFATLIYALCQMLFSIILMREDLWTNFHVQLSAHYIVILTMCIADIGLLRFLNRYFRFSNSIFKRIVADIIGITLICLILVWGFNFLIYEVLLLSKEGMPSFLVKVAFGMTTKIPILLVFGLIHYFESEQKAMPHSEIAKRKV